MKSNPFDITKAVDYTDNEIYKYWVDLDGQASVKVMKPDSLMPMIIVGSKGSGKTHIMKYYSYELQKIRCTKTKSKLSDEKFIGVYIRCSGFNASKFKGKGVSDDVWAMLYAYYWELWVGERITSMLKDIIQFEDDIDIDEQSIVKWIYSMFLKKVEREATFDALRNYLIELQNDLEYQVQNFLFMEQDQPIVDILVPVNHLTYGIPTLLKEKVPFFKDKYIMYLIDELENFSETQQQLIQTLLREKPVACTFRIGTRPYGIRTYYTLGKVEENHDGSEFEKIILDEELRAYANYNKYVVEICENRLRQSELNLPEGFILADFIETQTPNEMLHKIYSKKESHSRSYMLSLKNNLKKLVANNAEIDNIISNLTFADNRVIERANVVLMYRHIKDNTKCSLLQSSIEIKESAQLYSLDKKAECMHASFLNKYYQDCYDMIVKEGRENLVYSGLDKLILMSCGTPRTILRLLKAAFSHQYFNTGEPPFEGGRKLDIESQISGISNTAEWFFEENRIPAIVQSRIADCVTRLGNYLQSLRFSDVPPQCAINLFTVPVDDMSEVARNNFEMLKQYSYIIDANERRTKNKDNKSGTFCLNSILLPKWELSLSKRGLVSINKNEANMLFDVSRHQEWDEYASKKLKQYNFPFHQRFIEQRSFFDYTY